MRLVSSLNIRVYKTFDKSICSKGIDGDDIKTKNGNRYPNQILCKHWHLLQDIADVFKVNIHYAKFLSFVKNVAFLSRSLAPQFLLSQGNTADSHA